MTLEAEVCSPLRSGSLVRRGSKVRVAMLVWSRLDCCHPRCSIDLQSLDHEPHRDINVKPHPQHELLYKACKTF
jgi:hypothetical protein